MKYYNNSKAKRYKITERTAIGLCFTFLVVMLAFLYAQCKDGLEEPFKLTAMAADTPVDLKAKGDNSLWIGDTLPGDVTRVLISEENTKNIDIECSYNSDLVSADGYVYLIELNAYESDTGEIPNGTAAQAAVPISVSKSEKSEESDGSQATDVIETIPCSFTISLKAHTSLSKLYDKFLIAVRNEQGGFTGISIPHYITNPETIATHELAYPKTTSKKGIMISTNSDMFQDAVDLGAKYAELNMLAGDLFTNAGIGFTYQGTTYCFNQALINSYDRMIKQYTDAGMVVTVILLNNWNGSSYCKNLMPVASQASSVGFYQFNTSTAKSINQFAALCAFLAERYNGDHVTYGRVSNWILGNEVNNQGFYNYDNANGIDAYGRNYARSLRIMYTTMRSIDKNVRVFMPLDQYWNTNASARWFGSRHMIDCVNGYISTQGDIDYGIAYHPYPVPLTETPFWDDPVTDDYNTTGHVTFKNISVLTDYISTIAAFNGTTARHVILSEQGFTSIQMSNQSMNQRLQAAAMIYAYYITEANPYIDTYIIYRHVDNPGELSAGLFFGIWTYKTSDPIDFGNTKKYGWDVYRDMDTSKTQNVADFALDLIGIDNWNDVIPNYSQVVKRLNSNKAVVTNKQTPSVVYQGYVSKYGWRGAVKDEATLDVTADVGTGYFSDISIVLNNQPVAGDITYRVYEATNKKWSPYAINSDQCMNPGTNIKISGIQIKLNGAMADCYDILYRAYKQGEGWTSWNWNGTTAGSTQGTIVKLQVKLLAKGTLVLTNNAGSSYSIDEVNKMIIMDIGQTCISASTLEKKLMQANDVVLKGKDGNQLSDDALLTTGASAAYSYRNTEGKDVTVNYAIVMRSDSNRDGIVNIADVTKSVAVMTGKQKVNGAEFAAMDANGDGIINIADITKTIKYMTQK